MIREAGPADFSSLAKIAGGLQAPGFNWPPAQIQSEFAEARTWVFGEESPAGFICFRENSEFIEITVLATSPQNRRQGIQSALIRSLQVYAAQQQKAVLLEVHAANGPAKALYTKTGFSFLNERKNYYSDGASALVLRWSP